MRVRTRSPPWITSELKKRMHDRDILKIKASKSDDSNDWSLFKKQRNIVNSEIRLAKQAYYQNSFNKYMGDSKKSWQTINELTLRKHTHCRMRDVREIPIKLHGARKMS